MRFHTLRHTSQGINNDLSWMDIAAAAEGCPEARAAAGEMASALLPQAASGLRELAAGLAEVSATIVEEFVLL